MVKKSAKPQKKKVKAVAGKSRQLIVAEQNPDPRQAIFLSFYLDPESETFGNAKQSAIRAKYSEEYADVITAQMPAWLSEKLGQMDMVSRAERNISYVLDLPTKVQAMGAFGPLFEKKKGKKTDKPILVENAKLLKIKADVSEFVVERLAGQKYGRPRDPGKTPPPPVVPVQINFGEMREKYSK